MRTLKRRHRALKALKQRRLEDLVRAGPVRNELGNHKVTGLTKLACVAHDCHRAVEQDIKHQRVSP